MFFEQRFTYVFDRDTSEPVWPIEERPVDTTTDVPGEAMADVDVAYSNNCLHGAVAVIFRGRPGATGSMVTKGGLLFIGGGDPYLNAIDKATGDEVWRAPTPNCTSGNPITYTGQSGRQYIVIATGAGPPARKE